MPAAALDCQSVQPRAAPVQRRTQSMAQRNAERPRTGTATSTISTAHTGGPAQREQPPGRTGGQQQRQAAEPDDHPGARRPGRGTSPACPSTRPRSGPARPRRSQRHRRSRPAAAAPSATGGRPGTRPSRRPPLGAGGRGQRWPGRQAPSGGGGPAAAEVACRRPSVPAPPAGRRHWDRRQHCGGRPLRRSACSCRSGGMRVAGVADAGRAEHVRADV